MDCSGKCLNIEPNIPFAVSLLLLTFKEKNVFHLIQVITLQFFQLVLIGKTILTELKCFSASS